MEKFRNVNYPYKDQHDTFIARGYHLNQIVEEVNRWSVGLLVKVEFGQTVDVILGRSLNIDAAFIDYKATFPDSSGIEAQKDHVGEVVVNNSLEHVENPVLSHSQESSTHGGDDPTDWLTVDIVAVGNDIIMRLINHTGNQLNFTYSVKLMKYVS